MNPTSLVSFYRTTRDFYKWVVDKDRKLSQVAPFTPAVDYSPNSGMQLGLLIEPESTNYFIDSEGLSAGVIRSSNVSRVAESINGSSYSLKFTQANQEAWAGANISFNADAVAVSFYVMQSNLQRPTVGYVGDPKTTISFRVNGDEFNVPTSAIDVQGPMNDLSYRVRVRMRLFGGSLNRIEIVKPQQSSVGMRVSRIQVEKNHWTSYIPTNGSTETRPAETVYRDLTHGVDINEDQGAFDVVFSPAPGAGGSAMTLLKGDWSEYIAFGHQKNTDGDAEAIRFYSSSTNIQVPLRFTAENITKPNAAVRASYSGYGVRGTVRDATFVHKLKDYDSFRNGKLNRLQFGESYDGTHFCGHIHMVNGYARTLTDAEMIEFPFVVNDSSSDIDFELETPSIAITAAALFRTDKEAILYQNVVEPPTPQRILAAWPRASSFRYFPDPSNIPPTSNPANTWSAGRWYYNGNLDAFVQPINSEQIEQIFSPIKIDTFEFEATMYADPSAPGYWHDDDYVGLVAASDIIGGDLVTVLVGTHSGGLGSVPRFSIQLIDQSNPAHVANPKLWNGSKVIVGNNFLTRRLTSQGGRTGLYTRIKITRAGPFLRAVATQWNDLDNYQENQELVVNLASLPGKGKLLADRPARYGFCSFSNTGSTYLDYVIRSDQVINDLKIYSEETNKFWSYANGSWGLQSDTAASDLLPATRINNIRTKENFIINPDTGDIDFSRSNGISENEGSLNVSPNATTDIPMSDLISQYVYDEPLEFKNIFEETNVIAEQIVLGGVQHVRIVSNATDGHFILLLGTEATTDAFGIKNETIAFRKVNVRVS